MWMSHDPTHPCCCHEGVLLCVKQSLAGLYGPTWRPGSGVSHYNITCLRLTGGEWLITAEVHHFFFSHCNFRIFLKRFSVVVFSCRHAEKRVNNCILSGLFSAAAFGALSSIYCSRRVYVGPAQNKLQCSEAAYYPVWLSDAFLITFER